MRVLLAEDDAANRDILSRMLRKLGAEVLSAADGAQAFALFRGSGPFDLAFLDLRMPIMDGIEAVRAMRDLEAVEGRPRVPIAALTGADSDRSLREAGFDGMVQKPVGQAELKAALERFLGRPPG